MGYLSDYQKDLKAFEKYLFEEEKAKLTVESYISDIRLFLLYLQENKIMLKNVSYTLLQQYKVYLHSEKYNIKSINRKIVSINQFLNFMDINIRIKQEKIQTQNFLDFLLTENEINAMIQVADSKKDYRAKALISTAKTTGMRVSEILQLTVNDTNKDDLMICGKGNKYRTIFISNNLQKVLNEYLAHRKTKYKTNKLFVGQRGAINRHTVYSTIRKYAELCNIDWRKAHTHNLRHYFARELLNTYDVDISTVGDVLGHQDLNTTRIYVRKSKGEILGIVNRMK